MRRRLNRSTPAPTTEAPAPAQPAAPVEAAPVAVAEPEAPAPAPAAPLLPATSGGDLQLAELPPHLAAVGEYHRPAEQPTAKGVGLPRLNFYHRSRPDALEIVKALGGHIQVGHPFVKVEGVIYDASQFGYLSLDSFPYWGVVDGSGKTTRTVLKNPGWGATDADGNKFKEALEAVVLMLPGPRMQDLGDLGPALAVQCTFKTTRCKALLVHDDMVELTTRANDAGHPDHKEALAWARLNPAHMSLPPRFRVASTFKVTPKPGVNPYAMVEAVPAPIMPHQYAALTAWSQDADLQTEFQAIQAGHLRAVEQVKTLNKPLGQ